RAVLAVRESDVVDTAPEGTSARAGGIDRVPAHRRVSQRRSSTGDVDSPAPDGHSPERTGDVDVVVADDSVADRAAVEDAGAAAGEGVPGHRGDVDGVAGQADVAECAADLPRARAAVGVARRTRERGRPDVVAGDDVIAERDVARHDVEMQAAGGGVRVTDGARHGGGVAGDGG